MGCLLAYYLSSQKSKKNILVVEEGGLPNEEGATLLAPGIWNPDPLKTPSERKDSLFDICLEESFGDIQYQARTMLHFAFDQSTLTHLEMPPSHLETTDPHWSTLINPAKLKLTHQTKAATYRPGNLALNAMKQAIQQGCHLMLNARAHCLPKGEVRLDRLTVTNTHQIVVHESHVIRPQCIVMAAGAHGPQQLEQDLGNYTPHKSAYVQYPHLAYPSSDTSPILRFPHLTLRPQHGGWTLIPAIQQSDPYGYLPVGGRLNGVQTGLRRELLEQLVSLMDVIPALATKHLQVGHSLNNISGAWVSLPAGKIDSFPVFQQLDQHLYLLLGGPEADTYGAHVAQALSQELNQELHSI